MNNIITVSRPELTPQEREKRFAEIKRATIQLAIAIEREQGHIYYYEEEKNEQQNRNRTMC